MTEQHSELGYLDMGIYQKVFELISGYLAPPDVQNVLDDLRKDLKPTNGPSLKILHQNTLVCTKCDNTTSQAILPSWNLSDPDILFVSSSPSLSKDGLDILVKSLKKTGFSSNRCALTYAVRCKKKTYTDQDIENCASYLYGEISHLKPKLIVLLGAVSVKSLTATALKQQEIMNTIYWLGPWAYIVLPSPSYIAYNKSEEALVGFEQGLELAYEFCYG